MSNLQIGDSVRVTIQRYDPTRDSAPYYKTYSVPYQRQMRVLEAIEYIAEFLDESLAYQWFCGVKKCGMCGVMVNGRPMLACWEGVQPEMVIEPLSNFPVVRDLVIDRSRYVRDMLALQPFLHRKLPYPGFPEPLSLLQMAGAAEAMHCIECMLCVAVCPAYGTEFVGPAALVQLAKIALDPREGWSRARLAAEVGGIAHCVSCYQCTQACPLGIGVLETCIDGLRRQVAHQGVGEVARHHRIYKELVLEQGLVNPSALMVRSLGWKVIGELPLAWLLFWKGRLSLGKLLKGLLKKDRLKSQPQIRALAQAVEEIDWEAEIR